MTLKPLPSALSFLVATGGLRRENMTVKLDMHVALGMKACLHRIRLVVVMLFGLNLVLMMIQLSTYEPTPDIIPDLLGPIITYRNNCLLNQRNSHGGGEGKKAHWNDPPNNNNNNIQNKYLIAFGRGLLDTDTDKDDTLNPSDCIDNDCDIMAICRSVHRSCHECYNCGGCGKKYVTTWRDCNDEMCLDDNTGYCIRWDIGYVYEYVDHNHYALKSTTLRCAPTGPATSNDSKIEFKLECNLDGCKQNTYWNGVRCDETGTDDHNASLLDNDGKFCLYCDNGDVYCHHGESPLCGCHAKNRATALAGNSTPVVCARCSTAHQ